jgi:hypothetical protein
MGAYLFHGERLHQLLRADCDDAREKSVPQQIRLDAQQRAGHIDRCPR